MSRASPEAAVAAAGTLLVVAMLALLAGLHGPDASVPHAVRWTARSSLVFFAGAFALGTRAGASGAFDRGLLLALAASHLAHLVAIAALAVQTGGANLGERGLLVAGGGSLSYLVIGMAVLRPHGPWAGEALWIVWGTFVFAYLPRALRAPLPFAAAILLLVVAAALRLRRPASGRPTG